MRKHYDRQRRLDCTAISNLTLNFDCRDESIPILAGLQYIYENTKLRYELVRLVAQDINRDTRRDVGRPGLDDWQIIVLAAFRLGCDYDYDKLQDQAENHRALRTMLGIHEWSDDTQFSARRIRDTLCRLSPFTFEMINDAIVDKGHELAPDAAKRVRGDSFVVETDIHYPTESELILDGMRKVISLCAKLAEQHEVEGWRQKRHLLKRIKQCTRSIAKTSGSKDPKKLARLPEEYEKLLTRAVVILDRAKALVQQVGAAKSTLPLVADIEHWIELTVQVCSTAYRRVIVQEEVPNSNKLFSLFEPHTQLYQRGKAGTPYQFGRLLLVFEDGAGFISHYHLMDRDATDSDVAVEETRKVQEKHDGAIETASLDRGFYSKSNEAELAQIIKDPCLPPKHSKHYAERLANGSVKFHELHQRHPGIESAIGALQSGNGLKRCRDRSEIGFERYLGLAILGRNMHVLGKLLIAQRNAKSAAAFTKRKAA